MKHGAVGFFGKRRFPGSAQDFPVRAGLPDSFRQSLDELRGSRLPLVPLSEKSVAIDGAVIDEPDTKADHLRTYWRGLPCPVFLLTQRLLSVIRRAMCPRTKPT